MQVEMSCWCYVSQSAESGYGAAANQSSRLPERPATVHGAGAARKQGYKDMICL